MLLVFIIILLYLYFDPSIDNSNDLILLWYNSNDTRKYIILWKKD